MNVLILGAGSVGQQLALLTRSLPLVKNITIADLNKERAELVARTIQGKGIELNVLNRPDLCQAMAPVDLVVSTVGPCSRFSKIILETAINIRRSYIDVSDDPLPTLEMLSLDQAAQDAGILAIIGMGASPGLTNLLAVEAGTQLDSVERLITGWGSQGYEDEDISDSRADSAALDHWVDQVTGKIPVWQNYQFSEESPLEVRKIYYPGLGHRRTYTVGHPEAVTLARRFPELRESVNVMDFSSYVIDCLKHIKSAVDSGQASPAQASRKLGYLLSGEPKGPRMVLSYLWGKIKDLASIRENWLPPFFAVAEGIKNEQKKIVGACLAGPFRGSMAFQTAVPTVIAIDMLIQKKIHGIGVKPPEMALDPHMFFQRMRPFLNAKSSTPIFSSVSLTTEFL